MTGRLRDRVAAAAPYLAAGIVFLTFAWALRNGFVDWDDPLYLDNTFYRGLDWAHLRWMFTAIYAGAYQPLVWLSYAVDYKMWGLVPFGFHLTNILIHSGNAVLFYFTSLLLLRPASSETPSSPDVEARCAALFAALFFAVHPLRVESVAWIAERKDVLFGLFYLLSVLAYLKRRTGWALLAFVLSLMSKGAAITLPAVLVLIDVYSSGRLSPDPRRWLDAEARPVWREKLPFAAVAAVFAALTLAGQASSHALVSIRDYRADVVVARAFFGLAFYLRKTLLPTALIPYCVIPADIRLLGAPYLLSAALVFLFAAGLWFSRRRWPALWAAGLYYLITVAPFLGLVSFGSQLAADRYSYLPCMAWAVLAGAILLRAREKSRFPAAAAALAALVVALEIGAAWRQIGVWRNSETLWTRELIYRPDSAMALNNMGTVRLNQGRADEAVKLYEEAVAQDPSFALAETNLGALLLNQGRPREAIPHLERSLVINPYADPGWSNNNLGTAYYNQQEWEKALEYYLRAESTLPGNPAIQDNIGNALSKLGRWDEAAAHYRKAVAGNPGSPTLHFRLGRALAARGETAEALVELETARKMLPEDPQVREEIRRLQSRKR